MLPDSFFPCAQTHLSSNGGMAIYSKNQRDLSKQITDTHVTLALVTDLKFSLHASRSHSL